MDDLRITGTRQAAVTANAYLKKNRHKMNDEEAYALRILIAAAMQNPDIQPAMWHCDTYCRKVRYTACEGEFCVESGASGTCPYLDEMLY